VLRRDRQVDEERETEECDCSGHRSDHDAEDRRRDASVLLDVEVRCADADSR
jgi:hypothetical protein